MMPQVQRPCGHCHHYSILTAPGAEGGKQGKRTGQRKQHKKDYDKISQMKRKKETIENNHTG
jgi:hypothetical protein